jgi:cytochrome P450 family 97 subfamily B polypeptide 3
VTEESPVIKSVYSTLREAEHRSMSFIPYWNIPFADRIIPDQIEFRANLRLLNNVLDDLIRRAVDTAEQADAHELAFRYDDGDDDGDDDDDDGDDDDEDDGGDE